MYIYIGFLSDEGPMLETLDYTIRIGSTSTLLYFDIYIYIFSHSEDGYIVENVWFLKHF